jgi:hypothetical protein
MNDRNQLNNNEKGHIRVPEAAYLEVTDNLFHDGPYALRVSGKVVVPKDDGNVSDKKGDDSGHKKADPPEMSPSVGHEKPGPSGAVRLLAVEPSFSHYCA